MEVEHGRAGTGVDLMGSVGAEHGHEAVAVAANDFGWNLPWVDTPGRLAIGLAGASAGLRGRGLPRWLGVLAVLVAIGVLMPWIGLFVAFLWRRRPTPRTTTRPAAPWTSYWRTARSRST